MPFGKAKTKFKSPFSKRKVVKEGTRAHTALKGKESRQARSGKVRHYNSG